LQFYRWQDLNLANVFALISLSPRGDVTVQVEKGRDQAGGANGFGLEFFHQVFHRTKITFFQVLNGLLFIHT
jgi:hypothetical protein